MPAGRAISLLGSLAGGALGRPGGLGLRAACLGSHTQRPGMGDAPRLGGGVVCAALRASRPAAAGSVLAGAGTGVRHMSFKWPPGIQDISQYTKSPIGSPDDPDFEKEIEVKSDEEMREEGEANLRAAEEYVKEQADLHYKENGRVMNDEELHELITQAMELHIAKPTSWQEMAMVESEKKRIRGKAAPEAVSASKETAKEAAYRRIPKLDKFGRAYATGKRKTSVARVWVSPGTGKVIVNKMMMVDYFKRMALKEEIFAPLRLTGKPLEWDVWCTVKGGGFSGQAGAIRHGVAQALQAFDIEKYRPLMKRYKLLTFDCRQVERKKPGQPKARKKFQWVKR